MDFISIDFETANTSRSSACALGIVVVKEGVIVDEHYLLIDPEDYFDNYCIRIHGITPAMVEGKPTFSRLWPSIQAHFNDSLIVAHNASFDMSVFRYCLEKSNIAFPSLKYFCTYLLSKKILSGLTSYRLDIVADHFGIVFNHHNALEDARAAAMLMIKYLEMSSETNSGELFVGGYRPFSSNTPRPNRYSAGLRSADILTGNTEFDESHPLYKMTIAFTGELSSMTRQEAMQCVVDIGACCADGVTKKVNFLVVGFRDFSRYKSNEKSGKMRKAESYIVAGQDLEIISEDDFLRML